MASTLHVRFESSVRTPKCGSVDKGGALHHRTVDACQTIRNYLDIFERMWRSVMRRFEACTEFFRRTYYKCTLSAVTHKLNVSGYILVWKFFLILVCETRAQSLSAPFT
jgi:hypothetical protein